VAKKNPKVSKKKEALPVAKELMGMLVDINSLKPDKENARMHPVRSIEASKASLNDFGFMKPIIALLDGTVIAGNGLLEAAKQLGFKNVPVVRFQDKASARAYAIADNRTAELSVWDIDVLSEFLKLEQNYDVGFSAQEIQNLIGSVTPTLDSGETNPNAEWNGMPSFDGKGIKPLRTILVHFHKQEELEKFSKLIKQEITERTRFIYIPKQERVDVASVRYVDVTKK